MIIIKMQGGLANKMFQYAFFKNLEIKGINVYIDDFSFRPKLDHEKIKLLEVFPNIKIHYASLRDIQKLGGGRSNISRLKRRLFNTSTFIDELDKQPSFYSNLRDNLYLQGLWANEIYFRHIETTIKTDFTFKNFQEKRNIELVNNFISEESVAIHVRKGNDYRNSLMTGTCDIKYYIDSINYMQSHLQSPKFYVFTDNKEWVNYNIKGFDYELVDWNPTSGKDNYKDMQLMSLAKHNIIANSTYSWWGAWLNNNPQKIVIGPRKWFNPINSNYVTKNTQILPPDWIAL